MKTTLLPVRSVVEPLEARIAPAFAAVLDLSGLNGVDGFQIPGADPGGRLGFSVNGAGDVNGDGIDDIILGAPISDTPTDAAGYAYVVFGKDTGFSANFDLNSLDGLNGFRIAGEAAGDLLGFRVNGAGDLNGDGFDDVVIGANYADPGGSYSGAAYVIFGRDPLGEGNAYPATLDAGSLNGLDGFKVTGTSAFDNLGRWVAPAGDINGDGFDDVAISLQGEDTFAFNAGAALVIFGSTGAYPAVIPASSINGANGFRLDGVAAYDNTGAAVSRAGDVNDDGIDDLIVSANNADANGFDTGAAYVVYGRTGSYPASMALGTLTSAQGFRIDGEGIEDRMSFPVDGPGDVNGDGIDDLFLAAYSADPNGDYSGASYIVYGRTAAYTSPLQLASLDGTNGFQINGEREGDEAGLRVAGAGDLNADGFADLLVGAPGVDQAAKEAGAIYVVFGRASFPAELELADLSGPDGFRIDAENKGDSLFTVAGAGDVNGDGHLDIIFGGPGEVVDGVTKPGTAYVLFGPFPRLIPDQPKPTMLTYTEPDGDEILIQISKGFLDATSAQLEQIGGGAVLRSLDLDSIAKKTAGATLTIKVKLPSADDPNPRAGGDGLVNVGLLNVGKSTLKSINISGNLTAFTGAAKKLLKQLKVGSIGQGDFDDIIGRFDLPGGLGKLIVAGDVNNGELAGKKVGSVKIGGNVNNTRVDLTDTVGNVTVAGAFGDSTLMVGDGNPGKKGKVGKLDLRGGFGGSELLAGAVKQIKVTGALNDSSIRVAAGVDLLIVNGDAIDSTIRVAGRLATANILGHMTGSEFRLPGKLNPKTAGQAEALGKLNVTGNLTDSRVLVGYDPDGTPVNPDVTIGKVTVVGTFATSSIVAGALAGGDGFFGTDDDTLIPGGNKIVAKIAAITIKGGVAGSAGAGDGFGIVAEELGKFTIGDETLDLSRGPRNDMTVIPLGGTDDVRAREVSDDV